MDGDEDDINFCNEIELSKIEEIYQYLNNETKDITKFMTDFSSARGSCDRMSVISSTEEHIGDIGGENMTVTIRYVAQSYQEVNIYFILVKQCIHKNTLVGLNLSTMSIPILDHHSSRCDFERTFKYDWRLCGHACWVVNNAITRFLYLHQNIDSTNTASQKLMARVDKDCKKISINDYKWILPKIYELRDILNTIMQ